MFTETFQRGTLCVEGLRQYKPVKETQRTSELYKNQNNKDAMQTLLKPTLSFWTNADLQNQADYRKEQVVQFQEYGTTRL